MSVMSYWIDIEDGGDNKLGAGPLRARGFAVTKRLTASGEFRFEVGAADPNAAILAEKRVAICRYIDNQGQIATMGGGVIDNITASFGDDGQLAYIVSGNDLSRELTYRSVGALMLALDSAGVYDGPAQIMALAPPGWNYAGSDTLLPLYVGFDGENVLNALVRCAERAGEHWRLGAGRDIVWLGPAAAFTASGARAVQHVNDPVGAENQTDIVVIMSLEERRDAADVITRIIPRGSGNGSAVVTLAAVTDAAPAGYTLDTASNYLRADAAEALYGRIERVVDFKDLGPLSNTTLDVQNAANMLLQASAEYLRRYSTPCKAYSLQLAGANRLLEPGTTMRVVYRKIQDDDGHVLYDLDGTFNLIEVTQAIDETGLHTTQVGIATSDRQPLTDSEYLVGQAQNARVFASHQQLGASVDNLSWRDEMDNSHAASFRFWLGDEYTTIQRALLRFRVQPLRSTVKSAVASSGGGSSETSATGGGGSVTSSDGGGRTVTGGAHGHGNPYNPNSLGEHSHVLGDHNHSVSVPSHSHGVTIPSHTHSVTTTYGIYEASAGSTLELSDLIIKLNGGTNLLGYVEDLGGGWYALDLTQWLINDIYRPVSESNQVVITTTVAKTARIEAQMTIRGVVQAVAYL